MTKARKEHKCDLCAKPIKKGEDYSSERTTPWEWLDKDLVTKLYQPIRRHRLCQKAYSLIVDEVGDPEELPTFMDGGTFEVAWEYLSSNASIPFEYEGEERALLLNFYEQMGLEAKPEGEEQ